MKPIGRRVQASEREAEWHMEGISHQCLLWETRMNLGEQLLRAYLVLMSSRHLCNVDSTLSPPGWVSCFLARLQPGDSLCSAV